MSALPIPFPEREVEFSIYPGGNPDNRVICWITYEALIDRFGATDEDSIVRVLLGNMNWISHVAERVSKATPKGKRIIVRSQDFQDRS